MAIQGPQPNTNRFQSSVQNVGTGTNAKGSGKRYGGPKGFFQWGHNQYGYINPAGDIKWNATPAASQRLIGYGAISPWAKRSGALEKRTDPFGMPSLPASRPAAYLDPQYGVAAAQLTTDRAMQQRLLANELESLRARYGAEKGQFQDDYNLNRMQLGGQLGSSGMAYSGAAGQAVTDLERGFTRGMTSLAQQFGAPAQERLLSQQRLLDANLRAQLDAQQRAAKERAKAMNELRIAQGLEPRSLTGPKKGFFKRGSTWFYRSADGVEVSVKGDPTKRRKVGVTTAQAARGVMPPVERNI